MGNDDHTTPDGTNEQLDRPPGRRVTASDTAANPSMNSHQSSDADEMTDLLTAFGDEESRAVLDYFRDTSDNVATLDDLVSEICTRQHRDPDSVKIGLHHSTLPRLDDVGAIEYDPGSNTARYHGLPELETILARIGNRPGDPL